MTETDLKKRISELEAQNLVLIAENRQLREALGLPFEGGSEEIAGQARNDVEEVRNDAEETRNNANDTKHSINNYSLPEEKIEFFMSLFRGRTDIYAKRCYSKKHDSSYYVPACKNEWEPGACDKTRTKCKNCANRVFLPLTAQVIENHLRNQNETGAGIVGVYPLLHDETCLFLAIDFDGADSKGYYGISRCLR